MLKAQAAWEHNNYKTKVEYQICHLIWDNHGGTTHMNKNRAVFEINNKSLL